MWDIQESAAELKAKLDGDLSEQERLDTLINLARLHWSDEQFVCFSPQIEEILAHSPHYLHQRAHLNLMYVDRLDVIQIELPVLTHTYGHGAESAVVGLLESTIMCYEEVGDVRGQINARLYLMTQYQTMLQWTKAREQVDLISRLMDDNSLASTMKGKILYRIADQLQQMHLNDLAEEYSLLTLDLGQTLLPELDEKPGLEALQILLLQVGPLWVLCNVRMEQKRYEEALVYAEEFLRISQEVERSDWITDAMMQVAQCLFALERYDEMITRLEEVTRTVSSADQHLYCKCYEELGRGYLMRGQYNKAENYLRLSFDIYQQNPIFDKVPTEHLKLLSQLYEKQGETSKALHYLNQYTDQMAAQWEDKQRQNAARLIAEHEYRLKKQEADLLRGTNERLTESNQLLQQAYHEQGELLKIVAHDLQNPLQVIQLSASMIPRFLKKDAIGHVTASADAIKDTTEFMSSVVNQLLEMSIVDEGRMNLALEPLPVAEIVQTIVERNQEIAAEKRIVIETEFIEPVQIFGDRAILERVFSNLLSNSIKYSPPDTIIMSKIRKRNGRCEIAYIDNGIGMKSEELSKLFTKFGRLPSSRPTAKERSTGLGLYITKKQVEAMNGTITAASPGLNQGSTFTVTLPLATIPTPTA